MANTDRPLCQNWVCIRELQYLSWRAGQNGLRAKSRVFATTMIMGTPIWVFLNRQGHLWSLHGIITVNRMDLHELSMGVSANEFILSNFNVQHFSVYNYLAALQDAPLYVRMICWSVHALQNLFKRRLIEKYLSGFTFLILSFSRYEIWIRVDSCSCTFAPSGVYLRKLWQSPPVQINIHPHLWDLALSVAINRVSNESNFVNYIKCTPKKGIIALTVWDNKLALKSFNPQPVHKKLKKCRAWTQFHLRV